MKRFVLAAAATGMLICAAAPALADVKAGVDAWRRGDYAAAVAEWRGPAQEGDADAQFNLAQAYKLGRGVPADLKVAEQWYRKAALQGHRQAADNYGLALFQNGKHAEALSWLEKSAARGEPRAEYVLGTMYFNGKAVPKDWVRAYALMSRAADGGLPQASETRTRMDRYISLGDRQAGVKLAHTFESGGSPVEATTAGTTVDEPQPTVPAAPTEIASAEPARTPAEPPTAPVKTAAERPAPTKPRPARDARDGGWRVQLGAFGQPGNARALWKDVGGKVAMFSGRKPFFVNAGKLTKMQVGPFASQAEASKACTQVKARGTPCLTVRE